MMSFERTTMSASLPGHLPPGSCPSMVYFHSPVLTSCSGGLNILPVFPMTCHTSTNSRASFTNSCRKWRLGLTSPCSKQLAQQIQSLLQTENGYLHMLAYYQLSYMRSRTSINPQNVVVLVQDHPSNSVFFHFSTVSRSAGTLFGPSSRTFRLAGRKLAEVVGATLRGCAFVA